MSMERVHPHSQIIFLYVAYSSESSWAISSTYYFENILDYAPSIRHTKEELKIPHGSCVLCFKSTSRSAWLLLLRILVETIESSAFGCRRETFENSLAKKHILRLRQTTFLKIDDTDMGLEFSKYRFVYMGSIIALALIWKPQMLRSGRSVTLCSGSNASLIFSTAY